MFVIRGKIKGTDNWEYLTIDCGYYTFTEFIGKAKFFKTHGECVKILNSSEINKPTETTDGVICPSYALHHLSQVNYAKMSEDVELTISEIKFDDMFHKDIHCEIKRPTRTVYKYD